MTRPNALAMRSFSLSKASLLCLLIFAVNCCSARKELPDHNDNSAAVLLGLARDAWKNGDVHSKAVKYYREIINAEWNTASEKRSESKSANPEVSNSAGNKSPVSEALFELAEVLEGLHSNTSAMSEGFTYLSRAASKGHVMAQHRLASAFATGLFGTGLIPMNAGKALMLEYMAALGGSPEAAMGMGNRYLYGIGVPESCETSKAFYEFAANVAADQIRQRGQPVHSERVKISETEVAATSGRKNIDAEVVDYYKHLVSGGGDSAAAHTLGGMYLQGSRFVEQDVQKAIYYLSIAADIGHVPASGQLGYLLAQQLVLRLNGINEDRIQEEKLTTFSAEDSTKATYKISDEVKKIKKLLVYASNRKEVNGQLGLGYLHFTGLSETAEDSAQGTLKNISMAFKSFKKLQGKHADAGFFMGEILMGRAQPTVRHPSPKPIFGPPLNRRGQIPQGSTEAGKSRTDEGGEESLLPADSESEESRELLHGRAFGGQGVGDVDPEADVDIADQDQSQDQDQDHGQPLLVQIDPVAAFRAYAVSWQRGNLLALHRISHMAADGVGMARSCSKAVSGFKIVAERGDWSQKLTKAHRFMDAGDKRSALALFSTLAAVGVESAQFNTAYILMKATDLPWLTLTYPSPLPPAASTSANVIVEAPVEVSITQNSFGEISASLISVAATDATTAAAAVAGTRNAEASGDLPTGEEGLGFTASLHEKYLSSADISALEGASNSTSLRLAQAGVKANCQMRALSLYAVSASQTSAESFLRVGDCFYYGCGGLSRDRVEAAVFYQLAADLRNAHALFNLGIMHQAGDGVQQDFHLAKRFFDLAGATDIDARLPKSLALVLLGCHREMQDRFGVDATDQALELASTVSNIIGGYLSALVELVMQFMPADVPFADRGGRTWETRGGSDADVGSLLLSLQSSIERSFSSSLAAPGSATGAKEQRAGLRDMLALLSLSLVFLFIIRWKRRRQLQQRDLHR